MTIFAQLLEKLYRVAAKYRCASIVVGAAALAPLSLGLSGPALAANECGPLVGGSVTCPAGNYPNGISYNTGDPALPINITLSPGVIVNSPGVSGFNVGGPLPPTSAPITITATGTTAAPIVITGNPGTGNQAGLIVQSSGDAVINATNTTLTWPAPAPATMRSSR